FGFATNTAHPQQQNWLKLDEATGEIFVKESTSGFYNTAAIGNYAIVKVDLYPNATSTQIIATRYIKIGFVQNQVSDVNINGTASLTLTNAATQDATLYFTAPNTILDQAYNITGGSAAQFHGLYNWSFTSAETSGGAPVSTSWFTFLNMNNPNQNVERIVQVDQTKVNPGEYILKGKFEPAVANPNYPNVNITIKLTVSLNGTISFSYIPAYYIDNAARIYGKAQGANLWYMGGDMNEYINLSSTITGSNAPAVTYKFVSTNTNVAAFGNATFGTGNSSSSTTKSYVNSSNAGLGNEGLHLVNANGPAAHNHTTPNSDPWNFVSGRSYGNKGTVTIRIEYYLNGNPEPFKTEDVLVRFKNPVQELEVLNNGQASVTDKQNGNNNQDVPLKNFFRLKDYTNVVIWQADNPITTAQNTLLTRYGVQGLGRNIFNTSVLAPTAVSFERAYYNDSPTVDIKNNLPQFTSV